MAGVIMYLNKKYRVYTTANMVNEHIYNASGTDYSPNGATFLPHTNNLVLQIDGSAEIVNESEDVYYKGYMDNIEVYDNTLLYDDIVNVKYLDNILYMNNKFNNINLFNNKHLLFNFGNTNTKTLFEGNSNIGLISLSNNSYISYNLPLHNDTPLRYIHSNNPITNSLYIDTNTSSIYTDTFNNGITTTIDTTNTIPTIDLKDTHKLSVQLNTTYYPNTSITIRNNNNIVNSENIRTTLDYIADINSNDNIYKFAHSIVTPYTISTVNVGAIKNNVDDTTIDLLGSDTSTYVSETRNGSTFNYISLKNYIRFDFTKLRTVFLVFRTPVTVLTFNY